jgi:hypothetical protein
VADRSLVDRAPAVFVAVGVLMLLLATYMAGGDQLTCGRAGGVLTCDVVRTRVFGVYTAEHVRAADIVSLAVRQSSERAPTQLLSGSGRVRVTSNTSLIATTRGRQEVVLLGGEAVDAVVDDLTALMEGKRAEPVSYWDSYAIVAGFVAAMGLVFTLFGGVAMRLNQ